MAVGAAPPSVTCPSEHTLSLVGHLDAAEEGFHGWWASAVVGVALFRLEKTLSQAQDLPEDSLNRGGSAPQNVQHAGSHVPMGRGQWWPGRRGRVLWKSPCQTLLWRGSGSLPAVT